MFQMKLENMILYMYHINAPLLRASFGKKGAGKDRLMPSKQMTVADNSTTIRRVVSEISALLSILLPLDNIAR